MLANVVANEAKDELWWSIYAWWSCVLVLKMMLLTWYTGQIRVREQVIHSEEDRMWMVKKPKIILCPTGNGHPDVVRIRSAHQKDLKTVLPFLLITPLWLNVETCNSTVKILIPAFSMISIMYTLVHMQLIKMSAPWKFYFSISLYYILTYICAMTALRYTVSIPKLI
ncbi:prostaglandin E synthase-like [Linepithema humile]|uniref:prostaglandin E synthase-like n=1 Tax=Linepithema humile TaxID=83485 RepID=UPI0006233017|nr:PREDICTED: prostaglandin E synthase-like [Linepithema humile]